MSAPEVTNTYPADSDTGIPIGISLKIYFSTGVELSAIKNAVALFGADNDVTSGPDLALWADKDTGDNPFLLTSPTFKGIVPLKVRLDYYTLDTTTIVDPGVITSQADEVSADVGHVATLTIDPKYNPSLAPDTEFTLIINGDPNSLETGVCSRTIFDIEADIGNTGNGAFTLYGKWDSTNANDVVHIKVTTAGDIGTAKYKVWYDSELESAATTGLVTSRRYRTLRDGIQIRFTGDGFVVGDQWTFNVAAPEYLAENYKITFTTNDGTYSEAPDSPATPAESEPPTTISPLVTSGLLEVTKMSPENGSYNISTKRRWITITFNKNLDPDTITQENVVLKKYPVDGFYDETFEPKELQKTLEVEDNVLTIRF